MQYGHVGISAIKIVTLPPSLMYCLIGSIVSPLESPEKASSGELMKNRTTTTTIH